MIGQHEASPMPSGYAFCVALAFTAVGSSCGATYTCGDGMRQEGSACVPLAPIGTDASAHGGGQGGGGPAGDAGASVAADAGALPPPDETPPRFGGIAGAEPSGSMSVRVSWEPAADDVTPQREMRYRVYWSDTPSGAGTLGTTSLPGATSTVVALPQPETEYFFRVVAVDAAGNTDDNTVWLAGTSAPDGAPPVFAGCSLLADVHVSRVEVLWEPAVDETTPSEDIEYAVYAFTEPVSDETVFDAPIAIFAAGAESGVVRGLSEGTRYHVVCRARDANGNEDDNRNALVVQTLVDDMPPTFSGLSSLTLRLTEADLVWETAFDDVSFPQDIVYLIHVAATSGAHDFSSPYAVSAPGATSLTIDVPSNSELFFVVRAQDEAGNIDDNITELSGTTPTSFLLDVQPIFTRSCAQVTCHKQPAPPQGLDLSEGAAYSNIVDVVAQQADDIGEPTIKWIDSTSPVPGDSYLYRKIDPSAGAIAGADMSNVTTLDPPSQQDIDTIATWITQGAANN